MAHLRQTIKRDRAVIFVVGLARARLLQIADHAVIVLGETVTAGVVRRTRRIQPAAEHEDVFGANAGRRLETAQHALQALALRVLAQRAQAFGERVGEPVAVAHQGGQRVALVALQPAQHTAEPGEHLRLRRAGLAQARVQPVQQVGLGHRGRHQVQVDRVSGALLLDAQMAVVQIHQVGARRFVGAKAGQFRRLVGEDEAGEIEQGLALGQFQLTLRITHAQQGQGAEGHAALRGRGEGPVAQLEAVELARQRLARLALGQRRDQRGAQLGRRRLIQAHPQFAIRPGLDAQGRRRRPRVEREQVGRRGRRQHQLQRGQGRGGRLALRARVAPQRQTGREHRLHRLQLFEAHRHQAVGEFPGYPRALGARQVGIGAIEQLAASPLRVGHAQHAAEQLLHVAARAHVLQAAEHIGEGAVPALLERLDGDHHLHRAGRVEQVHAVQLALRAGRDGDALGRDVLLRDQVLAQALDVHLAALVLGLQQQDRTQVVAACSQLARRLLGEPGAGEQRVAYGLLPVGMGAQHDRQLDHLLGFELLGRDVVEHVAAVAALAHRGGGHLDQRRRAQAGEAVVAQRRARVVRLVDDHHRAVPVHQVGEAALDLAQVGAAEVGLDLEVALAHALEAGQLGGALEMRLEGLLVGIDVAPRGVVHPQRLQRADDHQRARADVLRADLVAVGDVEHAHAIDAEMRLQRLAVGVAGGLQRAERLLADHVGGHQPQRQRPVLAGVVAGRGGERVRAEQGLAAAGGDAHAHVGRGPIVVDEALRQIGRDRLRRVLLFEQGLAEGGVERGLVARAAGQGEEARERGERLALVTLEGQRHAGASCRARMS